jgi:NAD(P)H-dependent flavin oxidoreductase YrpB (nitropropane dioxygenase family)
MLGVELLDRLDAPVVQAGLGGGLAGAPLAAAVSNAGGLGTVGLTGAKRFAAALREARERAPDRPVSANLLLPFTRRAHVEACVAARIDAVSLFFGFDREAVESLHAAGIVVLHQVGTVDQARRALADGADALVAQGTEAGGHLLAEEPLAAFLPKVVDVAGGRPVLAAGGIATAADARAALDAGAAAVWAGTRFLLTDECAAHPAYKQRVLDAPGTIETRLFGLGWPDRHRVVPNAATERWHGSRAVASLNAASGRLARLVPDAAQERLPALQRAAVPLFSPAALLDGMPADRVDATPLYAGEGALRIAGVIPAADAVRSLAP